MPCVSFAPNSGGDQPCFELEQCYFDGEKAMFLKHRTTNHLLAVDGFDDLTNPTKQQVCARNQAGEEEQEPQLYKKDELAFASGEPLPKCWTDVDWKRC